MSWKPWTGFSLAAPFAASVCLTVSADPVHIPSSPAPDKVSVYPLATMHVDQITPSEVTASGTWTSNEPSLSYYHSRINSAEIACHKDTMLCVESFGEVLENHAKGALRVFTREYVITSWLAPRYEITAIFPTECVTSTLSINVQTKEVVRITRNSGMVSGKACEKEKVPHPVVETLGEWDISRDQMKANAGH